MRELAWHFVRDDGVLRDGRRLRVGEWLEHDGPIAMCDAGLHASTHALDALYYAPGSLVCRVAVGGEIIRGADKLVCSRRLPLWAFDATAILRRFARECALSVAHLWDAPAVVREYLETGDETLRAAARSAALDAACGAPSVAARAAARAAAWSAARDAAWSAAWSAASVAARAAAWSAAWAAARDAAWAEQDRLLESLLVAAASDFGYEICPELE